MSSYRIRPYTMEMAKRLGVQVRPSTQKGKKIDVVKDGRVVASIGAIGYKDFPTYIEENGMEYARERRRLYWIRHKADNVEGTPGWWALRLLW